jgi:PAP2 superfamily
MSRIRIASAGLTKAVHEIQKSTASRAGRFRSICLQGGYATILGAMLTLTVALLAASPRPVSAATPDPVLEWIGVMNTTVLNAGTAPNVTGRVVALVSASVFDAVNGIEPRFRPLHVKPDARHNASQRAAAIQAAYVILMDLYGAHQGGTLTSQHDASLAALASTEKPESIAAGVAWGQSVADATWAWKLTDGFAPTPPPFFGVQSIAGTPNSLGFWRPTPPANASGATPQLATITPWILTRPSQFRLPPPLALNSPEYLSDLNEVREMGSLSSTSRSSEQTEVALFWALNTPLAWNRVAAQLSAARGLSLTENAHLFAVLNVTLADAITACWDSKYRYIFWRPVTAIRAGAAPGDPDADWKPLLDSLTGTPAHPEYPSAHSTYSGAAAFILAAAFGENAPFSLTSEIRPGTRSYTSFSEAIGEIADARVFGGIHLRSSCARGNSLGRAVADYVSRHALQAPGDGRDDDED